MGHKFFVTGTDTDAGKTVVTAGLLMAAQQRGLRTLGLKPVAAGCEETPDGLRNRDALLLQQASSVALPYAQVNPVALAPAIAPHLAARDAGRQLSVHQLSGFVRGACLTPSDLVLVEGAGGWRVPLNEREMLSSLAIELNFPVILVVGMRLGCLNHTLLTVEAIRRDGLSLAGWVANQIDPEMSRFEDNLATLQALMPAPLLGTVPHVADPSPAAVAPYLDLGTLLN